MPSSNKHGRKPDCAAEAQEEPAKAISPAGEAEPANKAKAPEEAGVKVNSAQKAVEAAASNAEGSTAPQPEDKDGRREPFARAAREDDDGYDPWSDRPASQPFWEEDPWR